MELQQYRTNVQANPYHLVEPSPWPLLSSFSLLAITFSLVLYFHGYTSFYFVGFTLSNVVIVILLWFRDVTAEGTYQGNHTFAVQKGLAIGFALFLVSEVIVFFSVFWAFFHSALAPTVELGVHWPPIGIDPLSPFEVPLLNTLLLLSSGASITYAHHALIGNNRSGAIWGTVLTVVLAVLFTVLQGYEYYNAAFTLSDSVYGTVFYASTGCEPIT